MVLFLEIVNCCIRSIVDMKKFLIISMFLVVFGGSLAGVFYMKSKVKPVIEPMAKIEEVKVVSDTRHSYSADDVTSGCSVDDKIFCAIELAVKCTLAPELDGCSKDVVPSFILGKTDEGIRPTEISFEITKIKPIPGGQNISVYTNSDCNASWFGLCKGNVIYSLSQKDGEWYVANMYALEQ